VCGKHRKLHNNNKRRRAKKKKKSSCGAKMEKLLQRKCDAEFLKSTAAWAAILMIVSERERERERERYKQTYSQSRK